MRLCFDSALRCFIAETLRPRGGFFVPLTGNKTLFLPMFVDPSSATLRTMSDFYHTFDANGNKTIDGKRERIPIIIVSGWDARHGSTWSLESIPVVILSSVC